MANKHKGELAIEIEGVTYTLHLGINALAEAESVFSTQDKRVSFQEIFKHANDGSVTHLRGLLWAMLRRHHKNLSLADVGDLIDRVGIVALDSIFAEAIQSVVPDPQDLKDLGVETNPPKAQAQSVKGGTTKPSTPRRVGSV